MFLIFLAGMVLPRMAQGYYFLYFILCIFFLFTAGKLFCQEAEFNEK